MAPIICFVFIFLGCISISEVSSYEDCPDAKYTIDSLNGEAFFTCDDAPDHCLFNIKTQETLWVKFYIFAPEDITYIYYNVSISGDNIDDRASGKVHYKTIGSSMGNKNNYLKNSYLQFGIEAYHKGDLPAGEEAIVKVQVYFNENSKDTPDMCVTENIKIIEEEEDD